MHGQEGDPFGSGEVNAWMRVEGIVRSKKERRKKGFMIQQPSDWIAKGSIIQYERLELKKFRRSL